MSFIALKTHEWDKLNLDILHLAEDTMPKETKKFMKREGNRMATVTRRYARSQLKRQTGNYFKSIIASRAWRTRLGGYGVYVYVSRGKGGGNHAHLLEYGHNQTPGRYVPQIGRRLKASRTRAFKIFETSVKAYPALFQADAQKFIDKVVESGFTKGR